MIEVNEFAYMLGNWCIGSLLFFIVALIAVSVYNYYGHRPASERPLFDRPPADD